MERGGKGSVGSIVKGLLHSEGLYRYMLDTSVYLRKPELLKELRDVTASHPRARMGTAPDAGQMIAMLLKMINANRTIEIGVFTSPTYCRGYSLCKVTVINLDRSTCEMGLLIIRKAGIEHKIEFIQSEALLVLEMLLQNASHKAFHLHAICDFCSFNGCYYENEGSFDFAFVDVDKVNYCNYHERIMKLLEVGGVVVYDNTFRRGLVVMPEEAAPGKERLTRVISLE